MVKQNISLKVKPRDSEKGLFLPGQAASFDIVMRNETQNPIDVFSLTLNASTPVFRVLRSDGTTVGEYSPVTRRRRMLGKTRSRSPVKSISLEGGGAQETWINLWKYVSPYPKGSYLLEVRHKINGDGDVVYANQIPFEIVEGHPGDVSLGYESVGKTASILAWTAFPSDDRLAPQLLIRSSKLYDHTLPSQGGTAQGGIEKGSRLSIGQLPTDTDLTPGWVAVTNESGVELIRHDKSFSDWRSEKISLPLDSPVPVPGFPDRGHAVYLVTGITKKGDNVLSGIRVSQDETTGEPWVTPLKCSPVLSACGFEAAGAISLLFVSDNGEETTFSRIDVKDNGEITSPEKVVRTSNNEVLALAVDVRPGVPITFVAVEADRKKHNQLTLVGLPVKGESEVVGPGTVKGWPVVWSSKKEEVVRPKEICVEIAMDGSTWLALTDESGNFYGGQLNTGEISLLRRAEHGRYASKPHVAALFERVTFSCFTETGGFFYAIGDR